MIPSEILPHPRVSTTPLPIRAALSRDGVFNLRDLGGIATQDGMFVAPKMLVRSDALQRISQAQTALDSWNLSRVVDLRGDLERDRAGVFSIPGIDVAHHPVLDPTFDWENVEADESLSYLAHRYQAILVNFGLRLGGAFTSVVESLVESNGSSAVAFHCAVGKDRTGLLAALLLDVLGADHSEIIADYALSARAMPVQVNWLWALGMPVGRVELEDLQSGLWSAQPETMETTLNWLYDNFGGAENYLVEQGCDEELFGALRAIALTDKVVLDQ